ncbi:hypothetical protein EV13_2292 [Prochlorococcus sp. MIT 0702]|nr:hypothetical protein EV12_1989 [Prochlorococcus sp. MIT 0701]KGG26832.1 hypothetical protein EV13_2292 [Prochlorococcus sp. MIT 0702]KGG36108.1 hypothetical protein EV14_0516 [Prochlorococcus sp. MIT 0703]
MALTPRGFHRLITLAEALELRLVAQSARGQSTFGDRSFRRTLPSQ